MNGNSNDYLWAGTEVLADLAVVVRGDNGCIYTNMPDAANTKDTTVPNKKYVDNAIENIHLTSRTKYQHNLVLEGSGFKAFMSIPRSKDTTFYTLDEIIQALESTKIPCTGYILDGEIYYSILALDTTDTTAPKLIYLNPVSGEQMLEITNDDVAITDDPIEF